MDRRLSVRRIPVPPKDEYEEEKPKPHEEEEQEEVEEQEEEKQQEEEEEEYEEYEEYEEEEEEEEEVVEGEEEEQQEQEEEEYEHEEEEVTAEEAEEEEEEEQQPEEPEPAPESTPSPIVPAPASQSSRKLKQEARGPSQEELALEDVRRVRQKALKHFMSFYKDHRVFPLPSHSSVQDGAVVSSTTVVNASSSNSSCYCFYLDSISGIPVPRALVEDYPVDSQVKHRIRISLFDTQRRAFFGKTFSSPLFEPDPLDDGAVASAAQKVMLKHHVAFELPVFILCEATEHIVAVIECSAVVELNGIELHERSTAWSFARIFTANMVQPKNLKDVSTVFASSINKKGSNSINVGKLTDLQMHKGTPRSLLVMADETLESGLVPRLGCQAEYGLYSHKKFRPVRHLLADGDIFCFGDEIPGISGHEANSDNDPIDSSTFLLDPTIIPSAPLEIANFRIAVPNSVETQLLESLTAQRTKELGADFDKSSKLSIAKREVRCGVHSGRCFVRAPTTMRLETVDADDQENDDEDEEEEKEDGRHLYQKERRGPFGRFDDDLASAEHFSASQNSHAADNVNGDTSFTMLVFDGTLAFPSAFRHPKCALIIELEYTIREPVSLSEKKNKKGALPYTEQIITVASLVYLPFDESNKGLNPDKVMLRFFSGPSRAFSGRLVFGGPSSSLGEVHSDHLPLPLSRIIAEFKIKGVKEDTPPPAAAAASVPSPLPVVVPSLPIPTPAVSQQPSPLPQPKPLLESISEVKPKKQSSSLASSADNSPLPTPKLLDMPSTPRIPNTPSLASANSSNTSIPLLPISSSACPQVSGGPLSARPPPSPLPVAPSTPKVAIPPTPRLADSARKKLDRVTYPEISDAYGNRVQESGPHNTPRDSLGPRGETVPSPLSQAQENLSADRIVLQFLAIEPSPSSSSSASDPVSASNSSLSSPSSPPLSSSRLPNDIYFTTQFFTFAPVDTHHTPLRIEYNDQTSPYVLTPFHRQTSLEDAQKMNGFASKAFVNSVTKPETFTYEMSNEPGSQMVSPLDKIMADNSSNSLTKNSGSSIASALSSLPNSSGGVVYCGLQLVFVVDPSAMLSDRERHEYSYYMRTKVLCIDVWNANSHFPVGRIFIPLRSLVRAAGSHAVQHTFKYDIVDTKSLSSTTPNIESLQPVLGRLHMRIANVGKKSIPRPSSAAAAAARLSRSPSFSSDVYDHMASSPVAADGERRSSHVRALHVVHKELAAALRHDAANNIAPSHPSSSSASVANNHPSVESEDAVRRRKRVSFLKRRLSGVEDAPALPAGPETPSSQQMMHKYMAAALYRESTKQETISKALQASITTEVYIYPSFGRSEFLSLDFSNPYPDAQTFILSCPDPDLRPISKLEELEHAQTLRALIESSASSSSSPYLNSGRNLFVPSPSPSSASSSSPPKEICAKAISTQQYSVSIDAQKRVLIPFIFQSLDCGTVTFADSAASQVPTTRDINVEVKNSQNQVIRVFKVKVSPRPFNVNQTWSFLEPENETFRKFLPILPVSKKALEAAQDDKAVAARIQRDMEGSKYVRFSHKAVDGSFVDANGLNAISVTYRSLPALNAFTFYVCLYNDPLCLSLFEIWRVNSISLQRANIIAMAGQTSVTSLKLNLPRLVTKAICNSSSPEELSFADEGEVQVAGAIEPQVLLTLRSLEPGMKPLIMTIADSTSGDLLCGYSLHCEFKLPKPSRPAFDIRIEVGKPSFRKLSFVNQFNQTKTFLLFTDTSELLRFKDPQLVDVKSGESQFIGLKFSPHNTAEVRQIRVFINDDLDRNLECLLINVTYA